jgi:hypothetical protein
VISTAELLEQDYQVAALSVRLGSVFPQTQQARQRYLDYCATLVPAAAADGAGHE